MNWSQRTKNPPCPSWPRPSSNSALPDSTNQRIWSLACEPLPSAWKKSYRHDKPPTVRGSPLWLLPFFFLTSNIYPVINIDTYTSPYLILSHILLYLISDITNSQRQLALKWHMYINHLAALGIPFILFSLDPLLGWSFSSSYTTIYLLWIPC